MKIAFVLGLLMASTSFAAPVENWEFKCEQCVLYNNSSEETTSFPFIYVDFHISIQTRGHQASVKLNRLEADRFAYKTKKLELLDFKRMKDSMSFAVQTSPSDAHSDGNLKILNVSCEIDYAFKNCGRCTGSILALYTHISPGFANNETFELCPVFK